jgi:hypothetical protein
VVAAAFALTKEAPNSDALQTKDGFDIVHLVEVEPSRPLSLEEARPQIIEALKKRQVHQIVAQKAAEVAGKLRDGIKGGKPAAEAATAAGVKIEKLPAFALADGSPEASPAPSPEPKNEAPDMPYIKQAASALAPGEVSELVNTPNGGLLVVLEKRETIDPAQFAKERPKLENRALESQAQVVFYEWLRQRRQQAGVPETKSPTAPG